MMRYEPHLIAAVSGYEFAALVARRSWLPTVTTLVNRLPKPARRGLACAAGVWLWHHFNGGE
jgi:hypothetical protein